MYKSAVIYQICCKDPSITDIYIGSTCNLNSRRAKHRTNCHKESAPEYQYKVYKYIRNTGGFKNWDMILIEEYPCDNKPQLKARERYYFELYNATLNTNIPNRTEADWRRDNHKYYLEQQKIYRDKNKEKNREWKKRNKESIKLYAKKYHQRKISCECGSEITRGSLSHHLKSKKHKNFIENEIDLGLCKECEP